MIALQYNLKPLSDMFEGKEDAIRQTLEVIVREFDIDVSALEKACEAKDIASIGSIVHKLKPHLVLFEVHPAGEIAVQVEEWCKTIENNPQMVDQYPDLVSQATVVAGLSSRFVENLRKELQVSVH